MPENTLKIMSFNIRYGTAADGSNAWPNRKSLVIEEIRREAPQLIGLQEAIGFQMDDIKTAIPHYQHSGLGRDNGKYDNEHASILFDTRRLERLEYGTFWYSDSPDQMGSTTWGNVIPRTCSWARFKDKVNQAEFWIFNSHWDHETPLTRDKSAELLLTEIAARAGAGTPVIVTGDFNTGEQSSAFMTLLSHQQINLKDSFRMLYPHRVSVGTFNGFTGNSNGEKIDAILVSEDWNVLSADIINTAFAGRYASDHFPVTAILQWRNRE